MAKRNTLYINKETFQAGIHVEAPRPIDDRVVVVSLEDIYLNTSAPADCPFYGRAYKGLQVAIIDTADLTKDAVLMIMKDDAPYVLGEASKVDATNYLRFWTVIGKASSEHIAGVVDPSINALEEYIKTTTIANAGAIDISVNNSKEFSNDSDMKGTFYDVKVKVDGTTIKIVDDKVTGGEYTLAPIDVDSDTILSAFQLKYKGPGETDFVAVGNAINIPKDFVLDQVHVCKATRTLVNGKYVYTETSVQDVDTPEEFDADPNPTYLHFIWNTKSDTGTTNKTETYLSVSDVINDALKSLVKTVNDISTDLSTFKGKTAQDFIDTSNLIGEVSSNFANDLNTFKHKVELDFIDTSNYINEVSANLANVDSSLDDLYGEVVSNEQTVAQALVDLNARCDVIDSSIENASIYYNPNGKPDTDYTITAHGNLPANTTVAQLKNMTISQILTNILFEVVAPKQKTAQSVKVFWKGGSAFSAGGNSNSSTGKMVDVSLALPTAADFAYTYQPEVYYWQSEANPAITGGVRTLSTLSSFAYKKSATNTNTGGSETWSGTVAEGTNGYYYVDVAYLGNQNAVDSANSETDKNGNLYKSAQSGTVQSTCITFAGGFRILTNALKIQTASLYDQRNTSPGASTAVNNETQTKSGFFASKTDQHTIGGYNKFYCQWPGNTTSAQSFYIYVPQGMTLSCKYAHPTDGSFFVSDGWKLSETTVNNIDNGYGAKKNYVRYEIKKSAGITTVELTLS